MSNNVKREYLAKEPQQPMGCFDVMICEDDHIIATRQVFSTEALLLDAGRWSNANPGGRVALEYRSGVVQELR